MEDWLIELAKLLGPMILGGGIGWVTKAGRAKDRADAFKTMEEAFQMRIDDLHKTIAVCNKTIAELQGRVATLNHKLDELREQHSLVIDDKNAQIRNLTEKLYLSEQEINRVQNLLNDAKDLEVALVSEHLRIENNLQLELAKKKCEEMDCPWRRPPTADTPPMPEGVTKEEYHSQKLIVLKKD